PRTPTRRRGNAHARPIGSSTTDVRTATRDLGGHMSELAELLERTAAFVRRFVVMSDEQATTVALWVAHTHFIEAADTTPYLSVSSAEKRSGKTRLFEVLRLLVRQPFPTVNISDAVLFRSIEERHPAITLLFDEIDAIFGRKARDREDLRGMLNAG